MKRVASLIVFLLVAGACAGIGSEPEGQALVGDPATFCARWPAARSAIVTDFDLERLDQTRDGGIAAARAILNEVGPLVPAALRAYWDIAAGYRRTVASLLDIAGSPEGVRVELTEAAFVGGDPEAAEKRALDAVAAVDEWAIAECGDFRELWPRLVRALRWPIRGEGGADFAMLQATGRDDAVLLSLADPLVPMEVREIWDTIAGTKLSLVELVTLMEGAQGPNRELDERSRQILDPVRLWESTMDESFDQAMERLYGEERQGGQEWRLLEIVEEALLAEIGSWVGANSEFVAGSGLPGLITIHTNESGGQRAEGTLLVVALPVGEDIRSFDSARGYLGALCFDRFPADHVGTSAVLLEREAGFEQPCAWLEGFDYGGPRPAVLNSGKYDLFFGLFTGGVGAFDHYIPAPASCKTLQVVVDGDTDVDVPALEPCDMGYLAGSPEEFVRRNPPPPEGPTGSLRLIVTEFEAPEDPEVSRHGGLLRVVLLPRGTTLNAVGRGDVWPSGAGCLWLPNAEFFDQRADEEADRAREADRVGEEADRAGEEADRAAREAERAGEEAQRAGENADRARENANRAWEEAERARAEADQAGAEAGGAREEAERAAREAQQAAEEADQVGAEAEGPAQGAERARAEADQARQNADRARENADRAREEAGGAGGEADRAREEGVALVVTAFPASGDPRGSPCPFIFEVLREPWRNNEVVPLAFGTYDIHVERVWEGDERATFECARLTVEIDGDVVVPAPEMGTCP